MYYVYQLVDPRNSSPFYIGKGTGQRAKTHLQEVPDTRNVYKENKIAAIREIGLEPIVEYIVKDIVDEALAYDIETLLIKKHGRKGYDEDGILTNICEDNRPPNHKGKTYEEIYGVERAKEQRELRSRLQKERGGYGPVKHTLATKQKIGLKSKEYAATHDCSHSDETKQKIGCALAKYVGRKNKKSLCYVLTSSTGEQYKLWGGELKEFCLEHNLSFSTLKRQVQANPWGIPKKGKTKGWKLEIIKNNNINEE